MKRVAFLLLLLVSTSYVTMAQTISFGPELGLNFNRFVSQQVGYASNVKPGIRVGMNLNFPLAKRSFLSTGIFYNQKGQSQVFQVDNITHKEYHSMDYIQMPVNFMQRFRLDKYGSIMAFAGAYLGYGFEGNYRLYQYDQEGVGIEIERSKINWGDAGNQMNPFDLGLNIGASYETPFGFYLKFIFAQGLLPVTNNNIHEKYHQSFQLCAGLNIYTWLN